VSETPTVYQAWSAVMADVQAVGKTGRNKQQNYNFRGVDAVVNAAGPAMREHGVIVGPTVKETHYRDITVGQNHTAMREVTVKVRYSVIGPAGDVLTVPDEPEFGVVCGESMDSGDKGTAKAMSVAYRIFLLQALCIPTDEPDPDEHSYERAAPPPAPVLPEGHVWVSDAKSSVMAVVQGDKRAAGRAWKAAGLPLDGIESVTDAQAKAALDEAEALMAAAEGERQDETGEQVEEHAADQTELPEVSNRNGIKAAHDVYKEMEGGKK
jgi:hypothetical protein